MYFILQRKPDSTANGSFTSNAKVCCSGKEKEKLTSEGETNNILVNRQDVLGSMKEKFKTISNRRLTLEVSFLARVQKTT